MLYLSCYLPYFLDKSVAIYVVAILRSSTSYKGTR